MQKLKAAIGLLDLGVDDLPRQAELAELLRKSATSSELLEKLQKIIDPTASLALQICRAFRQEGRHRCGMELLQKADLPIPCDDESRRLYVNMQREIAICESYVDDTKACQLYADALRSSIDLLGRAKTYTINLRILFVTFLERSSRYSGALDVLEALDVEALNVEAPDVGRKDRLRQWKVHVEERLRVKRVKKRRHERPMPAEQTLIEDDKENMHQSELYSSSKKQKLMQEASTQKQGERQEKTQ